MAGQALEGQQRLDLQGEQMLAVVNGTKRQCASENDAKRQ